MRIIQARCYGDGFYGYKQEGGILVVVVVVMVLEQGECFVLLRPSSLLDDRSYNSPLSTLTTRLGPPDHIRGESYPSLTLTKDPGKGRGCHKCLMVVVVVVVKPLASS